MSYGPHTRNPIEMDEPDVDLCPHGLTPDEPCENCDDRAGEQAQARDVERYHGNSTAQYTEVARDKRGRQ